MNITFFQGFILKHRLCRILGLTLMLFCVCAVVPYIISAQQKKVSNQDLFSVSFPTDNDGWACGRWGTVLHTSDGGKTWISQDTKTCFTLSSIYFVDPYKGWAVGDQGTIIHTKDGGKTWEKQKSPIHFFLMDLYFVTPLKGFIVTERTHILFTDDGGKTWNVQFSDKDYILKAISFSNRLNGWAVGEYGFIYHTIDGGATWEKQGGFFSLDENTGEPIGGTFLFDVVAIDPQTAWAVGIDGYVTMTVDGGKTWKEVDINAPNTQLFCVATDRVGTILIGGKGVFLSYNYKEKTLHSPGFNPPIIYGWIYGLTQRGSVGFVAVGWEGAIYVSAKDTYHRIYY